MLHEATKKKKISSNLEIQWNFSITSLVTICVIFILIDDIFTSLSVKNVV